MLSIFAVLAERGEERWIDPVELVNAWADCDPDFVGVATAPRRSRC